LRSSHIGPHKFDIAREYTQSGLILQNVIILTSISS